MSSEAKQVGTCKRFNATKGFGFITDTNSREDLFVHHSAIYGDGFKTLGEGEQVEYDVQTDNQGRKKAINVTGPNGAKVVGDQRGRREGGGFNDYRGGGGGYNDRGGEYSGSGRSFGGRGGDYGGSSYGSGYQRDSGRGYNNNSGGGGGGSNGNDRYEY